MTTKPARERPGSPGTIQKSKNEEGRRPGETKTSGFQDLDGVGTPGQLQDVVQDGVDLKPPSFLP